MASDIYTEIFFFYFSFFFLNFETKQLFTVLSFPRMASFILALLAGLGGFRALSVEHTVRAGELSQEEERKRGVCREPTDSPEENKEAVPKTVCGKREN